MQWRIFPILLLGLGGIGLLGGCGPGTATVSGTVTVDGHPVENGVISYIPAEGKAPPATASIQNGKYELQTVPGNKRVQISAPVVTGKIKQYNSPDAPLMEVTQESVPERYNSNTELRFEVKAGSNTKDWSIEGKGLKKG